MNEITIKKSSIKTDIDGFNNCPSRKEIRRMIKRARDKGVDIKIVDAWDNSEKWLNTDDILVFMVEGKKAGICAGLVIGDIALRFNVDEFNFTHLKKSGKTIIRLWWD